VAGAVVHLLRHGEVHNPSGVLYGRLPGYRLSERGLAMAERIAQVMGGRDIVRVVSSPLERAQQTAAPLAAARGVPVDTDERLVEAGSQFEGRTFGVGDKALAHPSSWWHLRNPFRPSWGEPYDVIAARMLAAVRDVAASVPGREALLVSHQLPIWTARNAAEGHRLWHDPRHRQCSLASVTSLTVADGQVVAVGYAEPARDLLPVRTTHGFQVGA
jgi:broad specificity phosphatase PhoE